MDDKKRKFLYEQLKTFLQEYGDILEIDNTSGKYSLSTTKPIIVDGEVHENGYYFAGLRELKNIVGFYFTPIHAIPELRDQIPERLAVIQKGNTCFNVKQMTDEMERDLKELMKIGIDAYREMGWI